MDFKGYLTLLMLLLVTACSPASKSIAIKEPEIALNLATIVNATSIYVIRFPQGLRIVTIVDKTIADMDKSAADDLAIKVVKLSSRDQHELEGVTITFKTQEEGMPKYVYNWSFQQKHFVKVI